MDAALDLSRWRGLPHGVNYRRWSILFTALRLQLRTKLFKALIGLGWSAGLLIAASGFVFSQAVAHGGWLETYAARLGPRFEAITTALAGFVALYPDVCIGGIFTLIFWVHAIVASVLTLVALTTMLPSLITRDRASNALIIYLARPLTTTDYLVGKLGTIVGTILLVWTGPLLVGWLVAMLFATDRDFIVYSLEPLSRALLFNVIATAALSAIALGVSAAVRTQRVASMVWLCLWLILGTIANAPHSPLWLKRISFTYDLREVRQQVLRPDDALSRASRELPLLSRQFSSNLARAGEKAQANDFGGALAGLGALVVLSSSVFFRKLRPE